jgi:hypothetical protein
MDGAALRITNYDGAQPLEARPGLHIFTDIELLTGEPLARASAHHDSLRARPHDCVVWNDPARSARRHEVLDRLAREGVNRFRARRVEGAQPPADLRYPLFLRDEYEHLGPLTPPLPDAAAVRSALASLRAGERPHQPLLAVEYLDYADRDGVFRKYSCFRLGPQIEPRHLFFSRDWVVKYAESEFNGSPWLDEERRFLATHEHHAELESIFKTFAIDYGRIDYTVTEDRVQVFEINTNPMIVHFTQLWSDPRRAVHRAFADVRGPRGRDGRRPRPKPRHRRAAHS